LFDFDDGRGDNQKAEGTDIICDVSDFSTLVIAGDDAQKFMQGEFTNDVKQVDESKSKLGAF